MLTNKEKRLVQYLLQHKEEFTTSMALAEHLSCSDRTIRTYIRSIVDALEAIDGVTLLSKQGQGYRLEFADEVRYRQFSEQFQPTDPLFKNTEEVDLNDRHSYILNKLLLEQENLYFDDLVEELYVSRSTLSNDFKKIRKDLEAYGLSIESKANRGVYVKGDEQAIRRFIMDYFFNSSFFQSLYQYVGDELVYGKINFEALTVIVLDECREAQLKLSDFVIQNLVVHIALAIRRLAEGFKISAIEDQLIQTHSKEYQAAKNILERVSLSTRLDFPKEEVAYITLHLLAKGQLSQTDSQESHIERMRQELVESLEASDNIEIAGLTGDFQFMEGLMTHLGTLYLRLANQIVLENPLLEDIKANYLPTFDLAKNILRQMPTFATYGLSEDEIAYVALHFMAAQERFKESRKYNVLVICATGYGSAQMLRSRIENELRQYVHIVDVIGYYEITDQKLQGIDFIISSIDLSNLIFNVPVFTTSVFLKEEELHEIRQQIETLARSGYRPEQVGAGEQESFAQLFDCYFSADTFLIEGSGGANKNALLREMVARLGRDEEEAFVDRMLDLMAQREQLSSVLFSEAIAVPHPIKPVASRLKMAVALIPKGLVWEEGVDQIRFIFLPALSKGSNDGLKVLTKAIVDLVDRPEIQEKLLACQTFEAFRNIMIEVGGES
ncbi:lichenan operon transcriptional antiterminator [Streptococcus rupicaprae]|uniref:Lichenan operon transcriptional antiterminator n=1 Tax=Streptococcus rupicaprae TaxID=759619 RepID=A0ABV2FIX6_9STRE